MGMFISGLVFFQSSDPDVIVYMGVVVVAADATDLRGMRGRMVWLGISLAFFPASTFSGRIMRTEWRVDFGVGVGMDGVIFRWAKDWSERMSRLMMGIERKYVFPVKT